MDKTRLSLISLHVLITIELVYELHPHLSFVGNASKTEKQISAIIGFVSNILRIALYHSACILAIWCCRRYGAGMIRGTGILLIGELLDVLTTSTQHSVETHSPTSVEVIGDVFKFLFFLAAIVLSFQLAREVSKYQIDLMQLELLTATVSDPSMGGGGQFAIV